MFYLLSFFWFIRETRVILFYLHLWQLKEYHIGRFLDHFKTEKGKKLIFNEIIFIKIVLFIIFLYFLLAEKQFAREGFLKILLVVLIIGYFIEFIFALKSFFQKKLKIPLFTKKAIFLFLEALLVEFLIILFLFYLSTDIFYFAFWLLIFDILAPIIFSLIILSLEPLAVLVKNRIIINKAKVKRSKYKDLMVVGITGSYGKTSTKEFLATILSEKFRVLKTQEHQNSEVGISRCILNNLTNRHQIFVVEMGAYGVGTIKFDCDIVKPKIGILTGINEQHLALFGSQENIIKAKYELIESLPPDGLAIFNGDNKHCLELYKMTKIPKMIYSVNKLSLTEMLISDIWVENIKIEKEFISFKMKTKKGEAYFTINILGRQNISNILAAALTAYGLGMSLEEISKACLKIKPEHGGIKSTEGKDGINILDSSYSANSDGVIADLDYLKIYPGKKIIVMPCLIELGKTSKEVHKRIGQKIAEVCDLAIIITKERFEDIKEGAVEKGMAKENISFLEDMKEIVERIKYFSMPGDSILIEGRVPKEIIEQLRR